MMLTGKVFPCHLESTPRKPYRNPVIYARELHEEMVRSNLSRKQLADKHGVTSDRITQWLCLLKLPESQLREIESLGDNWEQQMVTERELRSIRRSGIGSTPATLRTGLQEPDHQI